jgi:cysteinyl-tRNA synthetase
MKLYNTQSRSVEELTPLSNNTVKIYTCGLTVYSQPHIGNWLGYIYWDILVRALRAEGLTVERTQNITDVGHLTSDDDNGEDKMEKGAKREGITAWDIAAKYTAIADQEARLLGLQPPEHLVRATDMIPQQIAFAEELDTKGYLYEIPGDGMYFDTSKLQHYGALARLDIAGLEAGARVSVEGKRTITDFAVWKFSPKDATRDMEWDSPWGKGFPGWHLECSVIARETLGDQIDIHTGGIDHIPVHHTNEIAQTEAVTGKPFSQFWVHNNHLKSDGTKISKSLGNVYTLKDIQAKGYNVAAFRVFALGKHYRTEGNFTWDNLEAAANRLHNWHKTSALALQPVDSAGTYDFERIYQRILTNLTDDLDTVHALSAIDAVMENMAETGFSKHESASFSTFTDKLYHLTGIQLTVEDISLEQKEYIAEREQARANKDWAKSDMLRDTLIEQGIGLQDTSHGALWHWL